MGKISQESAKYIIHASINIDGAVDRPDVIGAIFGQTEGLLGSELELRELQRSGRIGRIEVDVDTVSGKTRGSIIIPSSLDKAETSIIGAALEIIQRIGPCNARLKVKSIEDVRISKRQFVIDRAKALLKDMMDNIIPDSQELADEVAHSVRMMEISEFGKERLPCGPGINDSDEIIVVEGRADVLNLLKHGFKNSIAMNGTNVPNTIVELCGKKIVTLFVDGDRGGDLIIRELTGMAEVDFVTKAPDGKEVEEITKKEIHKALRSRITPEQFRIENPASNSQRYVRRQSVRQQRIPEKKHTSYKNKEGISDSEKSSLKTFAEDLFGTRGAYILDTSLNILGKVPLSELTTTLKSLTSGVYAVVIDGAVDKKLVQAAQKINVHYLVGNESKVSISDTGKLTVLVTKDL